MADEQPTAPQPQQQPEFETEPATDKKAATPQQIAIIAGVALLLLIVLLYVFVLRGGGDEEALPPPPEPAVTETPPQPTPEEPEPRPGRRRGPVETFEVFAPKDPFEPLVQPGGAGTGTTEANGAGGEAPAAPGEGVGEPGPGGAPGGSGGESVQGHTVTLVTSDGQTARVQIDGTVYTVSEGERFAENFELVSLTGDCATMLFGDDQFSVCEGEQILK
jgi:hypothetical protein